MSDLLNGTGLQLLILRKFLTLISNLERQGYFCDAQINPTERKNIGSIAYHHKNLFDYLTLVFVDDGFDEIGMQEVTRSIQSTFSRICCAISDSTMLKLLSGKKLELTSLFDICAVESKIVVDGVVREFWEIIRLLSDHIYKDLITAEDILMTNDDGILLLLNCDAATTTRQDVLAIVRTHQFHDENG